MKEPIKRTMKDTKALMDRVLIISDGSGPREKVLLFQTTGELPFMATPEQARRIRNTIDKWLELHGLHK